MKPFLLLSIMLLSPGIAAAERYVYPFNMMTGEQVLSGILDETATIADEYRSNLTQYYLNGIKDGTQGVTWCFTGNMLPHELNRELAAAIKATRKPAELKGNAGPLIRDELRRLYPCRPQNMKGKS
ncbi:MAG: Rap1a/Tai family immunity protein [Telluria sp.]